ncbi:MAG: hypothetical protein ACU837_09360 [Gammaproteobacteria bacterium]
MKKLQKWTTFLAAFAGYSFMANPAEAATGDLKIFKMIVSPGASTCLPKARGRVTLSHIGTVDNMHVEVSALKPNTNYDFFVIQVPNAPFGLSWYQGDIRTNAQGNGVGDFTGIFSAETFIVAPGEAVVPLPKHAGDAPAGSVNPAIKQPIHTYHLGLWFNSPNDAAAIGCPATVTPFNGNHTAGIQVINTGSFPDDRGPLRSFVP